MSQQKKNAQNAGANRQQKREQAKKPQPQRSSKPLWMRIAIIAVMVIMLIGFFLLPLLR